MPQDRVEAVDRALTILNAFQEEEYALTLSDLAKRTGLYKSTILRLLGSLKAFGFVSHNQEGTYSLGSDLWRLGSLYRDRYMPASSVLPVLESLRDATKESASFYVRDGEHRICLYRANSERPLRHHLVQGARLPLTRGAAGRVLLAYGPDAPQSSQKMAMEDVRSAGSAVSLGERDPEVAAIAVPVFGENAELLGALSVSGLVTRFTEKNRSQYLSYLKAGAKVLTGTNRDAH